MRRSIQSTALAAVSTLVFVNSVAAGLQAAQYQGCYSSSYPLTTNSSLTYTYQSPGWCQQQCGEYLQEAAFGLTKGSTCYCGNELPANSTKVSDSECDSPCQGYGSENCGGESAWSVYTSGLTDDVESVDESSSSSSSTEAATATGKASSTTAAAASTVTEAGQTIVVTASGSSATSSSSSSSGGGASKAGIAAGVVVGVVGFAAIIGGVFFFMRYRQRKAIEEEHRREEAISNMAKSGTIKSERSETDSRLDPSVKYRRQSDGSIADETDFTRRVLKVTNPDRSA